MRVVVLAAVLFSPYLAQAQLGDILKKADETLNQHSTAGLSNDKIIALAGQFDLNKYVVSETLAGLFLMLGEEEKKIRNDPAAQTTLLLKEVFGRK